MLRKKNICGSCIHGRDKVAEQKFLSCLYCKVKKKDRVLYAEQEKIFRSEIQRNTDIS